MWSLIVGVASFIWQGVQVGLDAIVVALQWAAGALKAGLLGAWQAVKFTWSDIIRPIGQFIDSAFNRIKSLYTTVIKPALDWVGRVTKAVRRVYNTVLRPILSTIDHVRQVLQLLELLHVPLAAKLDAELADLERKISLPLQLVIRVLNGLSNRIESYVLTAENLFQKVTHISSIARDVKAIQNIHWNAFAGGLAADLKGKPADPKTLAPATDHIALFDAIIAGDDETSGIDTAGAMAVFDEITGRAA